MSDARAENLIKLAQGALREGNTDLARYYARVASQLAPDAEAPWLILAELSTPDASIPYFEAALKANPDNESTHMALSRARRSPEETQQIPLNEESALTADPGSTQPVSVNTGTTQPVVTSIGLTQPVKVKPPSNSGRFLFTVLLASMLLLTGWLFYPQLRSGLGTKPYAPRSANAMFKPSLTATNTPTPTPTNTPTPTPTPTATPTFTPTPTPTDTPTPLPTFTPLPTLPPPPVEEVSQPSDLGEGEHWIEVNLSEQRVYAWVGEEIVNNFLVSTGLAATPTVTGEFSIYLKFLADDMQGPGYFLPDVPYTMYFYKGYGLHGTYWHSNFGTPMSHGCVNMRTDEAAWLYDFASIGTRVVVHY